MDEAGETNNCNSMLNYSVDSDNIYPESLDLVSQPVFFDTSFDLTINSPCIIFKTIMAIYQVVLILRIFKMY